MCDRRPPPKTRNASWRIPEENALIAGRRTWQPIRSVVRAATRTSWMTRQMQRTPEDRLTLDGCTKNAIMCMICGFPFTPRSSFAALCRQECEQSRGVEWAELGEDTQAAGLNRHHRCVNSNSPRRRFVVNNAFEIRSQSLKYTDSLEPEGESRRIVENDDRAEDWDEP